MKEPVTRKQISGEGQMNPHLRSVHYYLFRMEWVFHPSIRDHQGRLIMLGITFYRGNP